MQNDKDTKQTEFEKALQMINLRHTSVDFPIKGINLPGIPLQIRREIIKAHTAALREKEREVLNNVMGTVEMSKANVGEQPDKGLHYILLIEDKINNRLTQLKDEENKKGIL